MDWMGSDHVGNSRDTHATIENAVFSMLGPGPGVIREAKFTVGVGASRCRSEFKELAVEGDKEEIKLCQEYLTCDLKALQVQ
jgi:hypothetical protein